MKVELNDFGFRWGNALIERTCSSEKSPKFQVLRVFCPNGEIVEIFMRPRSVKTTIHPREKNNKPRSGGSTVVGEG